MIGQKTAISNKRSDQPKFYRFGSVHPKNGALLRTAAMALLTLIFLSAAFSMVSAVNIPDASGADNSANSSTSPSSPSEQGVVYTEPQELNVTNRIAVLEVKDWGTIKIELYDNMTPITTENFAILAENGFYNGISFHRVIDDFVAQTGDPNTKNNNPYDDGWGGSQTTIPLEICDNATHVDGAVGMARSSEPDSASSQFYICDGPQHGLDDKQRMENNGDHGYAVFGIVIEGLDVAKKIAAAQTWGMLRPLLKDHPVDDIVMTSVTIIPGEPIEMLEDEKDGKDKEKKETAPGFGIGIVILSVGLLALVKRR